MKVWYVCRWLSPSAVHGIIIRNSLEFQKAQKTTRNIPFFIFMGYQAESSGIHVSILKSAALLHCCLGLYMRYADKKKIMENHATLRT